MGSLHWRLLEHINQKINEFKKADGWLYAIYGTPAESLCGLQVEQFRKKYGIIAKMYQIGRMSATASTVM